MRKQKSFYVGWQDEMPQKNKAALKKFIIPIFIALPILAFVIISFQKPFNNHQFELGKLTTVTGVYHKLPVPILEVAKGVLPDGLSNYIMLVGYGKFGSEGIMEGIEKSASSLEGKRITLQGTLIYGDGKSLMELTKKSRSLITVHDDEIVSNNTINSFEAATLSGEILDPKCYFGVMKPGEGKIHKSCAIRCISGGIPPVFRTQFAQNKNEYYILLGDNGEKINHDILDYVAEHIEIKGKISNKNGWNYLYTNMNAIQIKEN